jgi:hypothetical protein
MTSKYGATKVTPLELVYDLEAVLPVEINLQTCRVAKQEILSAMEYRELMMNKINEIPKSWALTEIEKEKIRVAKAYNKRVRIRSF